MQRCCGCMREFGKEYDVCPYCGYVVGTEPEIKSHLFPGTRLADRYILGKAIGHGGFGITYVAWDDKIQKTVAIKEYFPNAFSTRSAGETQVSCYNTKSEEFLKQGIQKMLDEARRLSKFYKNENIVDIFDFFEENNTAYIVMEYLEGKDLKKYFEENNDKFDAKKAVEVTIPILNALEDMHKEKLIHRDVAPDNIFLCNDGKIKLLDFGSARLEVEDGDKSFSVMIKRGYAPKEQYASRSKQGPWTDVYAVCATLYRMITGELPVESTIRDEEPLKAFSEYGIVGYEELERVVFKGLEVEYRNRTQNASLLKEELLAAIGDVPVSAKKVYPKADTTPKPSLPKDKPKTKSRINIKAIVGIVVAVAVVVAGVIFAFNKYPIKKEEPTPAIETSEVKFALSASEAEAIYQKFLSSKDLQNTYPDIYAVQKQDISVCSDEYYEYLEGMNVDKFTSAVISIKYYDVDGDGINEMLLSTDITNEEFYVDLYLFDIDTDRNVFEGGSFLRLMPSRCFDSVLLMQDDEGKCYFVKYANDGQYGKSCEKLVYNGTEMVREYSLSIPDYNLVGYSLPNFAKCTEKDKSVHMTSSDIRPSSDEIKYLTYQKIWDEWKKVFDNTIVASYCGTTEPYTDGRITRVSGGKVNENITWEIYENGCLLIEGRGKLPDYKSTKAPWASSEVTISTVVIGHNITSIGATFFENDSIRIVTMASSVTNVGAWAFSGCGNLEFVSLSDEVQTIGDGAFWNCSKLSSIHIPASVTEIGKTPFAYSDALSSITVDEKNEYYSSDENDVLFNKNKTVLIQYPIGNERTGYEIPFGVKTICESAFGDGSHLKRIVIPDTVVEIGDYAFVDCKNINYIELPDSNAKLGKDALRGVLKEYSLTVQFPNTGGSGKWEVYIGDNLYRSKTYLFDGSDYVLDLAFVGEKVPIEIYVDDKLYYEAVIDFSSETPTIIEEEYHSLSALGILF